MSYFEEKIEALEQRVEELESGVRELAEWPASPYIKERAKEILGKGRAMTELQRACDENEEQRQRIVELEECLTKAMRFLDVGVSGEEARRLCDECEDLLLKKG